jgi:protein gp37
MGTKIEWTNKVWNPVSGCTKVSEACQNCYAEVMARRLSGMPGSKEKYKDGFKVTIHPESLYEPYKWKKPCMVFVCSMGDLFHDDVPIQFIDEVMNVISENPQHTFQILTKRAGAMYSYFQHEDVPKNAWLGVTCESAKHYDRVSLLRDINRVSLLTDFHSKTVKFLSCEPLLGDMADINLDGIDWVITGGESGSRARRTPIEWFRNLRDRCVETGTPFFFKQWGAFGPDGIKRSKYLNGSVLDGQQWKQMPLIKQDDND